MIQKFKISRDDENDILILEEFAVLDGVRRNIDYQDLNEEDFSIVCKEKYDRKKLETALLKNKHAIILSIRTNNMYPIGDYAEAIADSITNLYESESSQIVELIFDDQKLLR
jgi:hypothetical protein